MEQRDTRCRPEDKLYYIHLVEQIQTTTQIERYQVEKFEGLNR